PSPCYISSREDPEREVHGQERFVRRVCALRLPHSGRLSEYIRSDRALERGSVPSPPFVPPRLRPVSALRPASPSSPWVHSVVNLPEACCPPSQRWWRPLCSP